MHDFHWVFPLGHAHPTGFPNSYEIHFFCKSRDTILVGLEAAPEMVTKLLKEEARAWQAQQRMQSLAHNF